jgi:hypothetical protein
VQNYQIQQYGSAFPQQVFDPSAMPPEDFFDELSQQVGRAGWVGRSSTGRVRPGAGATATAAANGSEELSRLLRLLCMLQLCRAQTAHLLTLYASSPLAAPRHLTLASAGALPGRGGHRPMQPAPQVEEQIRQRNAERKEKQQVQFVPGGVQQQPAAAARPPGLSTAQLAAATLAAQRAAGVAERLTGATAAAAAKPAGAKASKWDTAR